MARWLLFIFLIFGLSLLGGCGSGSGSGGTPPPPPSAEATHFSVTGPTSSPSGTAFSFTVTALDASNNTVTGYSGTVHFTSSDPHAQLPPDSMLPSGTAVFQATLSAAGSQMLTASDTAMSSIKGSSSSINISALVDAFAVEAFGAKGDGQTDDTAAIQSAINAAAAAGGGSVVLKVARYFTVGSFNLPAGVVLCGAVEGPFDVAGIDPAKTAIAPTLLVTNTTAPFITLTGVGAKVTDLLFHYPNQVKSSAATPTAYPYTVVVKNAGTKVARSTVANAYNFLDIEVGRTIVEDVFIGAFNIGVNIDHTYDYTTLDDMRNGVFWDEVEGVAYPTPIDNWVLNHGTAVVVNRVDGLEIHDLFVFSRFAGMLLTDSPDMTQNPPCAAGLGSDIDLENVQFGVIAVATQLYTFMSLRVGAAAGLGQAAVQLRSGAPSGCAPQVSINGVAARGTWALGAFPTPQSGKLYLTNMQ